MSPLKISLLLRMYSQAFPNLDMPWEQATAPAMESALSDFIEKGIVHEDVEIMYLRDGTTSPIGMLSNEPWLTGKGVELVNKLMAVEP